MKTKDYIKWLIPILIFSCGNPEQKTNQLKEDFYSKKTFHNDVLVKVENTDKNRNQIFEKESQYVGEFWNGKYVTWINAKKLDEEGKEEFNIWAHSNVGFKIYFPKRINDSTEIEMIIENGFDEDSSLTNKNQFGYINEINNSNELFNHHQIQKMFKSGNKYHFKKSSIDSNGNIVKEIYFEESGDTSSITLFAFDKNGNEVFSKHDNSYEYHNKFDSSGNEIKSKRINFDVRNGTMEIDNIEEWTRKYSNRNKLQEEVKTVNGEIVQKEVYKYDDEQLVNEAYFYHYEDRDEKYFEIQYFYENKSLTKQIEINYRDEKREEKNVRYKEK